MLLSLLVSAFPQERDAKIIVWLGVVGIESNGLVVVLDSLLALAAVDQCQSQVAVSFRIVRL